MKIYQSAQSLLAVQESFITEADVQNTAKKASKDCATKITAMDNLKAKIFQSNTQYLELYKEKDTNLTGLVFANYNPRNIKEFAELQDEIDLEYELNNIEDDLQVILVYFSQSKYNITLKSI